MMSFSLKNWHRQLLLAVGIFFLISMDVYASNTRGDLPFVSGMDTFKTNFMAWLFGAAVVLWVGTCLMLAFGEWSQGLKQIINIIFWLSLAFGGATGLTVLFGAGATF